MGDGYEELARRSLERLRKIATDRRYAADLLEVAIGRVRARAVLRGCEVGPGVCATGWMRVISRGRIVVEDHAVFSGGMVPTELVCLDGATLTIGSGSIFNYGASIHCAERVTLGARCMLASFVRISDRDGDRAGPVTIGDDVWIAHGAIIEPGVTIGARAVVSAGSVVTKDVPPDAMAIGNPARAMRLETGGAGTSSGREQQGN